MDSQMVNSPSHRKELGFDSKWGCMLVCSSCQNKMPQAGWLKQQGHFHSSGWWNPNMRVGVDWVCWGPPLWRVAGFAVFLHTTCERALGRTKRQGGVEPPFSYLCFLWVHRLSSSWLGQWPSSTHAYSCLSCSRVWLYPLQSTDVLCASFTAMPFLLSYLPSRAFPSLPCFSFHLTTTFFIFTFACIFSIIPFI